MNHEFTVRIRAPIRAVWDALTKTDGVQSFYFGSRLESDLRPGNRLRYLSPDGMRVFIEGRVVEAQAPDKFVHEFWFSDLGEERTRVTFALRENDGETVFSILHEGFTGETKAFRRSRQGWPFIQDNLKSWLERGKLPFRSRVRNGVMKLFLPWIPRAR